MLVSAQALATYLEQDYDSLTAKQKARYQEHLKTAGNEVRGALATLYKLPRVTRDVAGVITAPLLNGAPIADPVETALGPIVMMLAGAFLLDPARGIQPQEDRSAAETYRVSARVQLASLVKGPSLIAAVEDLPAYGITALPDLLVRVQPSGKSRRKARPGLRHQREGLFGVYNDPATGAPFDASTGEGEG
ncbi:hypothetical protein [Deinococcus peraridilitoris]|uniref:Uncharacterized protein n=1 Tax=Deinococcus peraridilitoris (strain DSM 19664 / LMG 22246 / CIP 109416 / KR-200) TaxID=937777 RepID=L0A1C7_DEIPD|nr:hypothetical protein [Deinococcus peraridilitoris]AFZ66987.1 hypothetical protein Deipe_1446 [Deinococcus peraridilitoris DSM 19664]